MAVRSGPPAAGLGFIVSGSAGAVRSELWGYHHCPVTARAGSNTVSASAPPTHSRACRVVAEPCRSNFSADNAARPPLRCRNSNGRALDDEVGWSGWRFSRAERRGSTWACVAFAAAGASDGASLYQTQELAVGSRREEEDVRSIERSRREEESDDDDDEGCRVPDDDDITARMENFIEQVLDNCKLARLRGALFSSLDLGLALDAQTAAPSPTGPFYFLLSAVTFTPRSHYRQLYRRPDTTVAGPPCFPRQTIFNCRFLTILAIVGSLAGSLLCFLQGSYYVSHAVSTWAGTLLSTRKTHLIIFALIEAVDVYLIGTVMLIFGCGLHGLFISKTPDGPPVHPEFGILSSSLFGMFRLMSTPSWVKIHSLEEMKTKLGHVIVMILLVGLFEKAKRVPVRSGADLLCLAASICLSSGSLFLLSRIAHR